MHTIRGPAAITSDAGMFTLYIFTLSDHTTWSYDQPIAAATAVRTNGTWQATDSRAFSYDGWNIIAETIQNQQSQIIIEFWNCNLWPSS